MTSRPEHPSPFGGLASWVHELPTQQLAAMYRDKCGADVSRFFHGIGALHLYECKTTTMRFWRPAQVSGDEAFYKDLSERWPNYYRETRWEYGPARRVVAAGSRVLEVGCGRGYFLRSIEGLAQEAVGLEFNVDAIRNKVTRFDLRNCLVDAMAQAQPQSFDLVCSFQVLEHVSNPAEFIRACVACIKPGGLLVLSTPNYDAPEHRQRQDAFDLPPHHLNHFTADAFRRIAPLYGLTLFDVASQSEQVPARSVWVNPSRPRAVQMALVAANHVLRVLFGTRRTIGHTVVASFRKDA